MQPAAERFAEAVHAIDWPPPPLPVVHNAPAPVAPGLHAPQHALLAQLYQPARCVECVTALAANPPAHPVAGLDDEERLVGALPPEVARGPDPGQAGSDHHDVDVDVI